MLNSLRVAVLGSLGMLLLACTVGQGPTSYAQDPQAEAHITLPRSGLEITASISAVTLGDECGSGAVAAPSSGKCAEPPPADAGAGDSSANPAGDADFAGGGCGGGTHCQQSNMQLAFKVGAGSSSARVEIVSVTLHDAKSGALLDTLTSSKPQAWTSNSYAAWDETLKPSSELKASYNLTAPAWSKISSARAGAYAAQYRLHVAVRIDGVEILLDSTDLSREPLVAT